MLRQKHKTYLLAIFGLVLDSLILLLEDADGAPPLLCKLAKSPDPAPCPARLGLCALFLTVSGLCADLPGMGLRAGDCLLLVLTLL